MMQVLFVQLLVQTALAELYPEDDKKRLVPGGDLDFVYSICTPGKGRRVWDEWSGMWRGAQDVDESNPDDFGAHISGADCHTTSDIWGACDTALHGGGEGKCAVCWASGRHGGPVRHKGLRRVLAEQHQAVQPSVVCEVGGPGGIR